MMLIKLGIIVVFLSKFSLSEKQNTNKIDTFSSKKNKNANIILELISEEEMLLLNKNLIKIHKIDKPLKRESINFKTMDWVFTASALNSLEVQNRIIAGKLISGFFNSSLKNLSQLKWELNSFECPKFENAKKLPLSKLTIVSYDQILASLLDYIKIFAAWYKNINKKFKIESSEVKMDKSDIENVKTILNEIQPKFNKFESDFSQYFDKFEKDLSMLQCSLKDFLIFYGALHRFYEVFIITPQSFSRDIRYSELVVDWSRWQRKIEKTVPFIRLFRSYTLIFREFIFYVKNGGDEKFIMTFQSLNIKSLNQMTKDYKRLSDETKRFELYFKTVRKTISGLEHIMKKDIPPIDRPTFKFEVIFRISLVLSLFVHEFCRFN